MQYLSEQIVGGLHNEESEEEPGEEEESGDNHWKVLGTLHEKKKVVPTFLWAVMRSDDYEAYMKEVLKCGVVIYDITYDQSPQRFAEIRAICDSKFKMADRLTSFYKIYNEFEGLRSKWPTFKTPRVFILISSLHSWSNTTVPGGKESTLSEVNYRFRRTHPLYRDLQLLERYVVASGKMVRSTFEAF